MMYKTTSLFLGLALLFSVPLFADQACPRIADRPGQPGELELAIDGASPLYVRLGSQATAGDRLKFEILVNGLLSLTEEVELLGMSAENRPSFGTPVVELLAAAPARLELLRRAAMDGTVEVTSYLGDTKLEHRTFADLDAESAALRTEGALPYDLSSELSYAAPTDLQNKYSCQDFCDMEQDDCYLNRCGQFGSASCYDACDTEWVQCMEAECGVCQPSSSTEVTETVDSTTPTSTTVCKRSFFNAAVSGVQRLMNRRIKRTETTTTTNSDCSETVTTNVTYYDTTCWKWINFNGCYWQIIENPGANC